MKRWIIWADGRRRESNSAKRPDQRGDFIAVKLTHASCEDATTTRQCSECGGKPHTATFPHAGVNNDLCVTQVRIHECNSETVIALETRSMATTPPPALRRLSPSGLEELLLNALAEGIGSRKPEASTEVVRRELRALIGNQALALEAMAPFSISTSPESRQEDLGHAVQDLNAIRMAIANARIIAEDPTCDDLLREDLERIARHSHELQQSMTTTLLYSLQEAAAIENSHTRKQEERDRLLQRWFSLAAAMLLGPGLVFAFAGSNTLPNLSFDSATSSGWIALAIQIAVAIISAVTVSRYVNKRYPQDAEERTSQT